MTVRRRGMTLLACLVALAVAGCGGTTPNRARPARRTVTEHAANGRFTVVVSGTAAQEAGTAGIDLTTLVDRSLSRIDALLPGPKTTITVDHAPPGDLIPQVGCAGVTNPATGHIMVSFGATPQVSLAKAAASGLPRALAHEVSHSVRILAGPGFGPTLLQQIISEGIATAFDQTAFPGPPDPWTHAVTPTRECALWAKERPQLGYTGLYQVWMFGGPGVPHWAGFTIGWHIVADYRGRHPGTTWAALAATGAAAILAGSHYQPCPR